jgi:hypothetical protein
MAAHDGQYETEPSPVARFSHPLHESLLKLLLDVERFTLTPDGCCVEELRDRLASLRTEVLAHFRAEEQDGLLSDLTRNEPRFEHAARRLRDEHRGLEENLETLLMVAAAAESVDDALRSKIRNWIIRARQHETDEDVLLMEAVNQELGAAD